jgi:hypothetical protein
MEPQIMSEIEFGRSIGLRGQTLSGQRLAEFRQLYNKYREKAVLDWEVKSSAGNMVRVNPTTGMVMAATNAAGQPQPMGAADPFAEYMNASPGVAGAAQVDTNSMAFQGVAPSAQQGAGSMGQGANAVAPVNVNPAMPVAAPAAAAPTQAPAPAPAPTPVANRVRVTAAEFEVQPGTAFPYKDEQGKTLAIIEVE